MYLGYSWFGIAVGLCCGHRPVNVLYVGLVAWWVVLVGRRYGAVWSGCLTALVMHGDQWSFLRS